MKNLSIADIKASEVLSIEEKKNIVGGATFSCTCDGKQIKSALVVFDMDDINAYSEIYCPNGNMSCKNLN